MDLLVVLVFATDMIGQLAVTSLYYYDVTTQYLDVTNFSAGPPFQPEDM
jgi:hypothetical protein